MASTMDDGFALSPTVEESEDPGVVAGVPQQTPSDIRVLRWGCSSLDVAPAGAVVRWQSHDPALPLLVDRSADVRSGATFPAAVPVAQDRGCSGARACTTLRLIGSVVEVQDWLVAATEPVGRTQPGTALVRLVRCLDGALDVVHRLRLSPQLDWFPLNGLAVGYLQERKITVDGGASRLTVATVHSRLQAPPHAWAALTVAVDGHLPANADLLAQQLDPPP
jgi:hypothetical protein